MTEGFRLLPDPTPLELEQRPGQLSLDELRILGEIDSSLDGPGSQEQNGAAEIVEERDTKGLGQTAVANSK
jgi:hypothetical protein